MSLEMLQQIHETLRTHDIEVLQEIAEEMDRLWMNPGAFEDPPGDWDDIYGEGFIGDENTHLVFHLGVCFGIEFERQYPTGDNSEWPAPDPIQEVDL